MRRVFAIAVLVLLLMGTGIVFGRGEIFPAAEDCDRYEKTVYEDVVHETCDISGDSYEAVRP